MTPLKTKQQLAKEQKTSNVREREIAKQYLQSGPSIQNLYNAFTHWYNSVPFLGGQPETGNEYITGEAPNPAKKLQTTANLIKFASQNRGRTIRNTPGQQYREFIRRFGDKLDLNKISVDDIYSAMRGRRKQLKSLKSSHAEYDTSHKGYPNVKYRDESGNVIGEITLVEDPDGWNRHDVLNIYSNKRGVGRKLYDGAIEAVIQDGSQGVVSGRGLVSAPKTYSTWKHYPTKKLIGNTGVHGNENMILENGDLSQLKEIDNGPIYLLNQPSQYVPVKHTTMFDPEILDASGNMQIQLSNPSLYRTLIPIGFGYGLYNTYER